MKRLLQWLADRLATKKIKVWGRIPRQLQDAINEARRMLELYGNEITDIRIKNSDCYSATIYYRKRKEESK